MVPVGGMSRRQTLTITVSEERRQWSEERRSYSPDAVVMVDPALISQNRPTPTRSKHVPKTYTLPTHLRTPRTRTCPAQNTAGFCRAALPAYGVASAQHARHPVQRPMRKLNNPPNPPAGSPPRRVSQLRPPASAAPPSTHTARSEHTEHPISRRHHHGPHLWATTALPARFFGHPTFPTTFCAPGSSHPRTKRPTPPCDTTTHVPTQNLGPSASTLPSIARHSSAAVSSVITGSFAVVFGNLWGPQPQFVSSMTPLFPGSKQLATSHLRVVTFIIVMCRAKTSTDPMFGLYDLKNAGPPTYASYRSPRASAVPPLDLPRREPRDSPFRGRDRRGGSDLAGAL
ncbi:hypothetical protein C8J57DRAFT_1510997 [Mycena rebaudengoi]|nr:hypothetical protein C8J57DRAFT_1510997 [Mycena rebaudengoi]